MSVIARFTRDGASKYVWAVLALAAIGGLAFAIMYGSDALERESANAQGRAVRYVEEELAPRLVGSDLDGPITGQSAVSLEAAVERTILADERLTRVRIWSADGPLLFSTDQADTPGSNAGLNDQLLRRVSREGVLTGSGISDTGGEEDPERSLVRTYVPLESGAIAEIDQTDEGTLAVVRTEWMYYRILAGAMLLLFLVLTGLSLRDPIEPINTGVPFASSSVPPGFSLIDNDRLHAVHEVYRLASERVGRLAAEARGVRRGAPPPGGSDPASPFEGNRFRVGRLATGTCGRGPAETGRRSGPRVRDREDAVRRRLDRCARRSARPRVPGSETTAGDVERCEAAG